MKGAWGEKVWGRALGIHLFFKVGAALDNSNLQTTYLIKTFRSVTMT